MAKAQVNGKDSWTIEEKDGQLAINGVKSSTSWEWLSSDRLLIRPAAGEGRKAIEVECIDLDAASKTASVRVNGHTYEVVVKDDFDALLEALGMGPGSAAQLSQLKAPMPGMVLEVMVSEGQTVVKDEPILILEAMKMENVIKAPRDGEIAKIGVKKGTAIEKNTLLVEFV